MMHTPLTILAQGTFWLPPAGSTSADNHDFVFHTVLYVTGFFFLLVVTLMLTFIVLYRRRKGQPGAGVDQGPTHNLPLELTWTGVPLVVVGVFFYLGFRAFLDFDTIPPNAAVIDVEARQWAFSFTYPNGGTSEKIILQLHQPVRLVMHSGDVLHALYIPAFRAGRNIVPQRTQEMWFQPTRLGTFPAYCTQYCGNGHSQMVAEVEVCDAATYQARLAELSNIFVNPTTKEPLPYAQVGQKLSRTMGCQQCHSIDGSPGTGPTWLGLYKRDHQFSVPAAGYTLTARDSDEPWDAYLRESILDPGAKIVQGFQNVMSSTYGPQLSGTPDKQKKLTALVEYIKSLDNHGPGGTPLYYHPMPTPAASLLVPTQPAPGKQ